MHHIENLFQSHPHTAGAENANLAKLIRSLDECKESCTACADACLAEPKPEMLRRCIRLNLDCADSCTAAARILSRLTEPDGDILRSHVEACAIACRLCGDECRKHETHHDHCRICAESCRQCEQACRQYAKSLGVTV